MNSLIRKTTLAAVLGATALTAAVPAEAQRYYGRGGYNHGYRHGGRGGTAVVAGIAGLAIGAALASNRNDRYRDGYYRDGYNGYYNDGYRNRNYYRNDGYYADRGYRGCRTEWRYDRYYDQDVRVRVCR